MPIDIKQFSGIMDTDSPNENIGQGAIKFARNIRYRGERKNAGNNLQAQNIPGTNLISNNLPEGNNECCGAFYDELKQRIFYCNYNSALKHGIYILTLDTLIVTPLLINGTNTDGNILDFNLDEPIYNIKMLYGDEQQGDTLYFNNSLKEPCQINIERTLAGTYGIMKRSFLEVIKYPANRPPYVVYGNDNSITVNNLRKKLFKFKTRPIYFSREKSVTSEQSEIPLPINYQDSNIDKDPTKNCKISIVYETLDADVEKIEILGAVSGKSDANGVIDPNKFGDFFLIQTIDKAENSLANNDLATFVFYNDQAYIEIDPSESIQLFDLVPLEANALEMLNGNVPIYAGITEGFDLVSILGSTTPSAISARNTQLPYIFVASQSGKSAFGTGNIHIVVIGTIAVGYSFTFQTTGQTVTFVATVATTANVIAGLAAAAIVAGFTVISSDSQNLVVSKTNESLQLLSTNAGIIAPTNSPVYNWNDREAFGIVYFDKADRTNGVITNLTLPYQTVNYTETLGTPNITQLLLSISNRPPLWAYSFSIVRTGSLAKTRFLYWLSDTTFKDTEFAYIGIENLNTFIKNNPTAKHLAYDFSSGDRIRFIKVLSGSVNTIYTNQDFEIVGQVLSPNINGTIRVGQYLKINLPTTSGTFDFGTSAFFNYEIELYTPAQSIGSGLNEYYEFGERYTIGNAGTANAYHQGMTQNQTSNLVTPALFQFSKGDNYYRNRRINVGAEYVFNVMPNEQGVGRATIGVNFISSTYTDPFITPGNSPDQNLVGFVLATNTDRALLNVTNGPYTFRAKGALNVTFSDFGEIFSFYFELSDGNIYYIVPPQSISQGTHIFEFDIIFQMSSNTRLFIFAYSEGDFVNSKTYGLTEFKITRELPYTVPIIDRNFSDYFPSAVNSNGRAYIEQPESIRSYNPILLRWGLPNIINTNINQVSRFTVLNFDEIDNSKGDIEYLLVIDRMLNVFQRRACGWYGIYAKVLQDSGGENVVTTTDEILTKNNIQYLAGNYGVGNQKGSITKTKTGYFFTDPVRGYQIRRAPDGLIPVNELYYGQYYIRSLITPYNDEYLRVSGSISKILGYYDYFEEQYVTLLQEGIFNGNQIENQMFAFNESRKGYCCFFDEAPEWFICAQDMTFSWRNGQVYIHNNEVEWGKMYGIQTYPSVTLVFNDKESLKKVFNALAYQSNGIWESRINGDIKTSMVNPQTGLQQISSLIAQDYEITDNVRYAGLLRDANSLEDARLALLEGDWLNGNWLEVTLTYYGNKFVFLYGVYMNYQINQRNF